MITFLINSILAHPAQWIIGAGYGVSAFITAMPSPDAPAEALGKAFYRYLYTAFHTLVNVLPSKYRPPTPEHL